MAQSRAKNSNTFVVPYQERILESSGFASLIWQNFFKAIYDRLNPMGIEQSFDMTPGGSAADVVGLNFDFMTEQASIVDFVIQRVTTESSPGLNNGQVLIEIGTFYVWFNPRAKTWHISKLSISGVTNSNVTLTITNAGQVQYASTTMTGIKDVDKITWRARTLKAQLSKARGPWV